MVGLVVVAVSLVPAVPAAGRVGHPDHPYRPGDPDLPGQPGPPGTEPSEGTATYTDLTGPGACSFLGEPADNLHVGLSTPEYGTAAACGGYLDVTGPSGTVRVKITDHCRRCAPGLIDVTRKAFARIADVDAGRAPVTYRLVRNPPLAETISLRMKDGSSPWWLGIQVLDHGNPIARVEVLQEDGWRSLGRTPDNFWEASDPGLGGGPFTVRITDVFDQQVTLDEIVLAPTLIQPTAARLYPPSDEAEAAAEESAFTSPFDLAIPDPATRSRPATNTRDEPPFGTDTPAPLWPLFLTLTLALAPAALLWKRKRSHANAPRHARR